jgi:hypothetical protein
LVRKPEHQQLKRSEIRTLLNNIRYFAEIKLAGGMPFKLAFAPAPIDGRRKQKTSGGMP